MEPRQGFFDEMYGSGGDIRATYRAYGDWFSNEEPRRLLAKTAEAERVFRRTGITFNGTTRAGGVRGPAKWASRRERNWVGPHYM